MLKPKVATFMGPGALEQQTLNIRGSIIVWVTSYLTGLDLTKQVKLSIIQHEQSS